MQRSLWDSSWLSSDCLERLDSALTTRGTRPPASETIGRWFIRGRLFRKDLLLKPSSVHYSLIDWGKRPARLDASYLQPQIALLVFDRPTKALAYLCTDAAQTHLGWGPAARREFFGVILCFILQGRSWDFGLGSGVASVAHDIWDVVGTLFTLATRLMSMNHLSAGNYVALHGTIAYKAPGNDDKAHCWLNDSSDTLICWDVRFVSWEWYCEALELRILVLLRSFYQ
jgi:hypothetical protein